MVAICSALHIQNLIKKSILIADKILNNALSPHHIHIENHSIEEATENANDCVSIFDENL